MNGKCVNLNNLTLRKKIWICFLLMLFSAGSVTLVFTGGLDEHRIKEELIKELSGPRSSIESNPGFESRLIILFRQLRLRLFWTLGIVFLGIGALFFFMLHSITNHLDRVADAARMMSSGHLNVYVPVDGCDEIGKIGQTMNDLAANLQEILLGLWNHTENCLYRMDRIYKNPEANPKIPDTMEITLQSMREDLEDMRSLIKSFEFYDVCLEKTGRVTALDQARNSPLKRK